MTYFLKCTIYANRCALCVWMGLSAEGGTSVPLSLPLGTARFSPFRRSQWRPTATQERLWWEKDRDRSILPAFENKLSSASKNRSFSQIPKLPISKQRCGFHGALPPCSYKCPRPRRWLLLLGREATVTLLTKKTAYDDGWHLIPPFPCCPLSS